LLEHRQQVGPDEGQSLAAQLLEAPDAGQVLVQAEGLVGAAAAAPIDKTVVAAFNVDQNLRRRRQQRGDQKGWYTHARVADRAITLDQPVAVAQEVEVLRSRRGGAGVADD